MSVQFGSNFAIYLYESTSNVINELQIYFKELGKQLIDDGTFALETLYESSRDNSGEDDNLLVGGSFWPGLYHGIEDPKRAQHDNWSVAVDRML